LQSHHKLYIIFLTLWHKELNLSEQRCLPGFFTGDFKFYCLVLGEEKANLIEFSFKFNEIKFCTLLMNCLIWEKMFTYFYNKFRSVAPWITVLSQHAIFTVGWFTNLLWCDIPLNKAPRTGPHYVWRIYTLCPISGHKNTDGSGDGWKISLASVCYCDSPVGKHFFTPSLVSAIRISLMASSSRLIFFPAIAVDTYNSALFTLLCMTQHSCSNAVPLRFERLLQQQQRSKAMIFLV
jgi:hypothetical protein